MHHNILYLKIAWTLISAEERQLWKYRLMLLLLGALAFGLSLNLLNSDVVPGLNLYLVLLSLPFALMRTGNARFAWHYCLLSLVGIGSYGLLGVQSLYFVGFCFYLLFLVESGYGRLGRIPFFLVLLLSPFTSYVVGVVSFPLRLKLTALAGWVLRLFEVPAIVEGNVIHIHDYQFAIDPACVGLKLVVTGYILAFALLAYRQQQQKQQISFGRFSLFVIITGLLILLANFMRILLLIFFRSAPETASHDLLGLACLAFYVIVPIHFIAKHFVKKKGAGFNLENKIRNHSKFSIGRLLFHISILGVMGWYNMNRPKTDAAIQFENPPMAIPVKFQVGNNSTINSSSVSLFKKEIIGDVVKLQNDAVLIYLKPCRNFYSSTHTPAICWKGSGYNFTREKLMQVNGQEVITAELHKGKSILYTAWWYDSGHTRTINQLTWRWQMLRAHEAFWIVNISAAGEEALRKEVEQWLRR